MRMKLYQRKPGDPAPAGQPDPYMIRVGDFYYVYATHDEGVQLYRSRVLTEGWEYLGLCYTRPGEKQFWAPAVMPFEGKYYLYYSSMPEGSEDTHQQRIQVAVGDSPEGPFAFVREMLPPFSIDAHAVSTDSGLYLFYSVNDYEAERAGTLIVADRLTDPCHVEGAPVVIVRPTIDEEIFQRDRFRKGQHWHTIEGAFYFREGDWHYVMYSGSAYTNETYFIGYSVAQGEGDLRSLASTSSSLRITSSHCLADLPARLVPRLHRSFHSRLALSFCVPTVLSYRSTGISTCYPSTTPLGLALGPDLPRADQLYPGNLRYSAGRIPTFLSLLIPAFSLPYSPQLLPVLLRPVCNAPLPIDQINS